MPARNIYNVDEVDAFVDRLARLTNVPALRTWLRQTARKWILKHHDRAFRIDSDPKTGTLVLTDPFFDPPAVLGPLGLPAPDWARAAIDAGHEVLWLRMDERLAARIHAVARHLMTANTRGQSYARLPFEAAEKQARRHANAPSLRHGLLPGTAIAHVLPNHMTAVALRSPAALDDEGARMANCVGLYAEEVESGESQIFSLRDSDDTSVATIELDENGDLVQVMARANHAIPPRVASTLRTWMHDRALSGEGAHSLWRWSNIGEIVRDPAGRLILSALAFADEERMFDPASYYLRNMIRETLVDAEPAAQRMLVRLLCPFDAPHLRLRPAGGFWAYDLPVPIVAVAAPIFLLRLLEYGYMAGSRIEDRARRIRQTVTDAAPALALRPPGTLYQLGIPHDRSKCAPRCWIEPADILADSDLEIDSARLTRAEGLRRMMNQAQRRVVGRQDKPSIGHLAVRRLLDGDGPAYVV